MKISNILSKPLGLGAEMRPNLKLFADLFQGISAGVNGGIANVLGWFQNQQNTEDSWDALKFQTGAQMLENQYARQWQSQMYNQQRDDWYKQQDYLNQIWKKQTDYENTYNTPFKQVSRLLAAGVNPADIFGQVGNAGNSSPNPMSSSPNPSAPSASGGSIGSNLPDFQRTSVAPTSMFAEMAQGMQALAQAKKAGVETTSLERSMDLEIKKLAADVATAELSNDFQKMSNDVFAQVKGEKVKQEFVSTMQGIATHIKTMVETRKYEVDTITSQYEALYYKAQSAHVNTQNWLAPKEFKARLDGIYADVKLKADESKYVQQRERAIRLENDVNEIRTNLITKDYQTRQEYISAFRGLLKQQYNYGQMSYEQYRAATKEADILESKAKMAQTDADYYEYEKAADFAIDRIKNILGIRNDYVGANAYNRYTQGYGRWVDSYDNSHNHFVTETFEDTHVDARGHKIKQGVKGKRPPKKK